MNLILEKKNPSLGGKCHHFHGNNILQQTMPFILATCPSCHLLCKALARVAIIIELERGLDVMEGKKIDCFIFINRRQENCEVLLWTKMKQRGKIRSDDSRWQECVGTHLLRKVEEMQWMVQEGTLKGRLKGKEVHSWTEVTVDKGHRQQELKSLLGREAEIFLRSAF